VPPRAGTGPESRPVSSTAENLAGPRAESPVENGVEGPGSLWFAAPAPPALPPGPSARAELPRPTPDSSAFPWFG